MSTTTTRPEPSYEAPDGYMFVAVVDPDWQFYNGSHGPGGRCRQRAGGTNREPIFCKKPAVARLRRGFRYPRWWAYCAEHMYGRWVEDGKVWHWVVRESPRRVGVLPPDAKTEK